MDWIVFKKLVEKKISSVAVHASYRHLVELSLRMGGDIEKNLHDLGIVRGNEIRENISGKNVEEKVLNLWTALFNYKPIINREWRGDLLIIDEKCPLCTNISVDFHYCNFIAGIVEAVIGKECFEEKCRAIGDDKCIYRVKKVV